MPSDLSSVLGYTAISKFIETTASGINSPLGPEWAVEEPPEPGNVAKLVKTTGARGVTKLRPYGGRPLPADGSDWADQLYHMLSTGEVVPLDVGAIKAITNDSAVQSQLGARIVGQELRKMRQRAMNTRDMARLMALSNGKIWATAKNFLGSSSGAVVTIDYGRTTATNEGAGQDMSGNALTGQAWGTSSTDVLGELRAIKNTALQRAGIPLRNAYCGSSVLGYLYANDVVKNAINGSARVSEEVLAGAQFMVEGIRFYDASGASFVDGDGSIQTFVAAAAVLFTPEPADNWWFNAVGTDYRSPAKGFFGMPEDAITDLVPLPGMQFYAEHEAGDRLAGVSLVSVDTFLPVLAVPDATYKLTVQS